MLSGAVVLIGVTGLKKRYPVLVAAICILLAVWLAAAAIGIFQDGLARRKEDPAEKIYTPEIVAERLVPALPLFAVLAVLLAAAPVMRRKDLKAGKQDIPMPSMRRNPVLQHERQIRTALITTALILIIAGIVNGSARDVLVKAITICTECIGLG